MPVPARARVFSSHAACLLSLAPERVIPTGAPISKIDQKIADSLPRAIFQRGLTFIRPEQTEGQAFWLTSLYPLRTLAYASQRGFRDPIIKINEATESV